LIRLSVRSWRWILAAVMAAGLGFALRPLSEVSPENWFPQSDKLVHVAFFALLWWMGQRARLGSALRLAVGLMAFAVGIELAQALFTATRSASPTDVAADGLGVLAGAGLNRRLEAAALSRQPEEDGR
jgi:hypothetical protein